MNQRGPKRSARRPARRDSVNITSVIGIVASAGLQRVVAGDLLQEEHEEEDHRAEPAVHREGLEVADREVAPPEQPQRQHRVGRAGLVDHERGQQRQPRDQRDDDLGRAPARARLADEREHRSRQPERAQGRADDVQARGPQLASVGRHGHAHDDHGGDHEGHVDGEDPAPGGDVDEPAPEQRPDDERDAAPRRPRADRRAALLGREARDDDRQRARGQQRAEHALQRAPRDQDLDRRRERRR